MEKKQANAKALLPILVFLILYLGSGIYFEYIKPQEGQMGFYIMSVVVAFGLALIVAFVQNRKLSFNEKVHVCAQGIGDDNIVIMLFIFLMAGAFSGLASAAGGASSTANLMLSIIPGRFVVPGIFVIACLISMAMGTSVGTITVLVPIAAEVAASTHMSLALIVGTVVGGAMFGDNLSVISDTTIAATRTQGVEMKDKFKVNFKIALPAALITLVILIVYSTQNPAAKLDNYDFNIWLAIPYFIVLILALVGLNVFLVLGLGILLFFLIGGAAGTISFSTGFLAMGEGTSGMFETMIVTILVASISALMKEYGGFEAVLAFIRRRAKGKKGGMFGICALTGLMDISTANNTVAIVIAAPIAKEISKEFNVEPKKVASLLDTSSCIFQGLIPYGAQILVAAGIAGISSLQIMPFLFYQFLLTICLVISILLERKDKKA
ncbi:MAG: Na+/H+ antiporter NhaC family protein [Lachnospiraceae bacterium]|nr:Na+/H+ antiporter NhaC family protein [Lachnospiraceae bacterium]MBQ6354136.1 Na+/H+ antiporter NhaC family protein [Lachnospiraceae bacterium]